jgi:hypothetical protein
MRKPKVTIRSVKKLHEGLQQDYAAFRQKSREYVLAVSSGANRRPLATINPVTTKGLVNGITIAELILMVKMVDGTGENLLLETTNVDGVDCLYVVAKKKAPRVPMELL